MNRWYRVGQLRGGSIAVAVALVACGPTPEPVAPESPPTSETLASTPAPPPASTSEAIPQIPVHRLAPVELGTPFDGKVLEADESDGYQTLLVEVATEALPSVARGEGWWLSTADSDASVVTAVSSLVDHERTRVWIRRPVPRVAAKSTDTFNVYTPAGMEFGPRSTASPVWTPGYHFALSVDVPSRLPAKPEVLARFLTDWGRARDGSPAYRLLTSELQPQRAARKEDTIDEWSNLIRFSTGYDSVEAALLTEEHLRAQVSPSAAKVSFASLKGPELRRHDWARMLTKLPGTAPDEPMATLVPAEFYYVRANSFVAFDTLSERVDEIITPGLQLDGQDQFGSSERYRLELGLPKDDLSKLLGPQLVNSLVVTGSDPMLRQGSDVSLICDVSSSEMFLRALAVKRGLLPGMTALSESRWSHGGIDVTSYRSPNGSVRQEVASLTRPDGKQFVLVGNSPNAAKRIIETWTGKRPSLASEVDFQYMLRRDSNVANDVLVYMGDRFVSEVVGPRQRILDSRRQVAKAELAALGYGTLLFGQLYGRLPKDTKELGAQAWFGKKRLTHASGDAIRYDELGPASVWGRPRRLTSIIDLPAPTRVSIAEQAAYDRFAESYRGNWGENIDPIALRIKVTADALDFHLRVLPLVNSSQYREVFELSGGGTTQRAPSLDGVAGILAIGAGSPLREFLGGNARSFLGDKFKLDWLGKWVEVGLADDPAVAELARIYGELPTREAGRPKVPETELQWLSKLPVYLALDVQSTAGASVLLTMLRELATGASPDAVEWGEHSKYGDSTIVHVNMEDVSVYYTLTKRRLLVALRVEVLHRLLDGLKKEETGSGERSAESVGKEPAGGQLVVEFAPRSNHKAPLVTQSALRTVLGWFWEAGAQYNGVYNPSADLLLGAFNDQPTPDVYRERALRWLGAVPLTADGKSLQRGPSGLSDPERGTAHAPVWPQVPVANSPLAQLLNAVIGVRTEISVDEEPGSEGERSLRARVHLGLTRTNAAGQTR
jgi:hypothetical protein